MIRLKVNRRSNVLLYAEMIIALLFFVISFAVIIRVFASADSLERRSRQRQSAALCAQSIAEAYSVGGDVQKAVSLALGADLRDFTGSAENRSGQRVLPIGFLRRYPAAGRTEAGYRRRCLLRAGGGVLR